MSYNLHVPSAYYTTLVHASAIIHDTDLLRSVATLDLEGRNH